MFQEIILVGNLGRDPEMRHFPNGDAVVNFGLAVNEVTGSGEDKVKKTVWFRISVFGRQAEACNTYLRKGSQVLVKGRLNFDANTGGPKLWSGSDGTVNASFEVRAGLVKFLGGGQQDAGEQAPHAQQAGQPAQQAGQNTSYNPQQEEDEIPF